MHLYMCLHTETPSNSRPCVYLRVSDDCLFFFSPLSLVPLALLLM